jgi:uncharacterized protein
MSANAHCLDSSSLEKLSPDGFSPRCVLDTNAALALWLFEDPRLAALHAALATGKVLAVAVPTHAAELTHVVHRRVAAGVTTPSQGEAVVARWHANVRLQDNSPAPVTHPAWSANPRCTDASDQTFVDAAIALKVRWLFSRDRAVLKLRKRMQHHHGVLVCAPEAWDLVSP